MREYAKFLEFCIHVKFEWHVSPIEFLYLISILSCSIVFYLILFMR